MNGISLIGLISPIRLIAQYTQYPTKLNNHIKKKTTMETKHTEFEEMRQQLDILKNKLDRKSVV